MIDLSDIKEIHIYKERCDLRMGIQGLSILAQELFSISEMKHKLFIFFGSTQKNIKILELDNDGWWLYQKKLFEGKYIFPKEVKTITKLELELLLNGLSIDTYRRHKEAKISKNY